MDDINDVSMLSFRSDSSALDTSSKCEEDAEVDGDGELAFLVGHG